MLDSLRANANLNGAFDRFNSTSITGIPMDPITNEVFQVGNYLREIQFSLDLSPSVNFAASNFRVSDLYDALFPTNGPTLMSFVAFIKKDILDQISAILDGLFDAKLDVPTTGLSSNRRRLSFSDGKVPSLGVEGINIGEYTESNNELFPPMIDIDAVQVSSFHHATIPFLSIHRLSNITQPILQGFVFDINVEVEDGALVIVAKFELHAIDVNPAQTLSDISTSLSNLLADSGNKFKSITDSLGSTFDSAADFFTSIAEDERITLLLNADLNVEARLALNFEAIQFSTKVKEMNMDFLAKITDTFDVELGNYAIHVTPSVQLRLQAENTALPFDVVQNPLAITQFDFSGDFEGIVLVGMDGFPAEISLRAYSPYLTRVDSIEFEVLLDIDLALMQTSE
jgi:hypothetical protein